MHYVFDGDIFYFFAFFVAYSSTKISNNASFNTMLLCIINVVVGGGFYDILEVIFWVGGITCSTGASYKKIWVLQFFDSLANGVASLYLPISINCLPDDI